MRWGHITSSEAESINKTCQRLSEKAAMRSLKASWGQGVMKSGKLAL